jgi:hypothetical protein
MPDGIRQLSRNTDFQKEIPMKSRLTIRVVLRATLLSMLLSLAPISQSANAACVKGRVSFSGKPVRSVWVIVSQGGQEKGRSLTGDDGKYYITNLPQGVFEIVVVRGKEQLFNKQVSLSGEADYDIEI